MMVHTDTQCIILEDNATYQDYVSYCKHNVHIADSVADESETRSNEMGTHIDIVATGPNECKGMHSGCEQELCIICIVT